MLKSNQSNNCCSMLTVCLAEEPKDQDYDYEQPIGILKLYNGSKYTVKPLNNEYIGRIYQMPFCQFFNEFYTILLKFQCLRK